MSKEPSSVAAYMRSLPAERRELVETLWKTVCENADPRLEEGIQYRLPALFLPHSEYPAGYHCDPQQPLPFASIASQKNAVSIYLFCTYTDAAEQARLQKEWRATGMRLDMGKSCIRVKKLDQVPLDVLGAAVRRMTVERFVAAYERMVPASRRGPARKAAKKAAKKTAKKTVDKAAGKAGRKTARKRSG